MTVMKIARLALAGFMFVLLATSVAQAATDFYISVVGAKQGAFKGESRLKGAEGKISGLVFDYAILSPRDPASGLATGRRQHKPIRITKPWGAASTQFFTAAATNEVLPSVILDFFSINTATGQLVLDHTIKLTNAIVVGIAYHSDSGVIEGTPTKAPAYETIDMTFAQIEMIDHLNKGAAIDQWMGGNLQ